MNKRLHALHLSEHYKDSQGCNLLSYAARCGHFDALRFLLKLGFNKDTQSIDKMGLLHRAAGAGHIEMVQFLLELGLDKDGMTNSYLGVLHYAARCGQLKMVQFLIDEVGYNVHQQNFHQQTPLMQAAFSGNEQLIKLLIEHYGANPHLQDHWHHDLEDYAKQKKTPKSNSQEFITFCANKKYLNELYANYFAKFIAPVIPYAVAQNANSIVAMYAGPETEKERDRIIKNIEELEKKRLLILKPLTDFCEHYANHEARTFLKELLAKKILHITDIERELDRILEEEHDPHKTSLYAIFLCRLETVQHTGNPPTISNALIHLKYQKDKEEFSLLNQHHKELQTSYDLLQQEHLQTTHHLNQQQLFSFQLKCLYACAIISSTLVLAAGIALLCMVTPTNAGVVAIGAILSTLGVIGNGYGIYGFFNHQSRPVLTEPTDQLVNEFARQ